MKQPRVIRKTELNHMSYGQRRVFAQTLEALIHKTTNNPEPEYPDFDRLYYKFPSYLRRAAISYATGQVSSYRTRFAAWEMEKHAAMSDGKRFRKKPPRLSFETNAFPVLSGRSPRVFRSRRTRSRCFTAGSPTNRTTAECRSRCLSAIHGTGSQSACRSGTCGP